MFTVSPIVYLIIVSRIHQTIFVGSLTRLLGSSEETYIGIGKSINLTCIVESDQNPTNPIIWFHNEQVKSLQ